jgi:hypothetical protein
MMPKFVMVMSTVDNKYYKVRDNSLKNESANALANINIRICKLLAYIKNNNLQDDSFVKRLYNYNPNSVQENLYDLDTTYTINKGSSIHYCLSPRNTSNLAVYDINTLMFVAIHELAHIASVSIGHTQEFKDNNAKLLKYAIECSVYNYIDYSKTPKEYCGIKIAT